MIEKWNLLCYSTNSTFNSLTERKAMNLDFVCPVCGKLKVINMGDSDNFCSAYNAMGGNGDTDKACQDKKRNTMEIDGEEVKCY
tara:strand:- start:29 stop:280 length:252 start_codon:yes stop_codon:yes gene_type:complete